ncbi:MAG TPA: hypothetical protein VKF84_10690 [Candidatus Sulfotelmatobacter sp.]|nr:hypothetical protein [Candidatus Sulfotelmatobacter sp.]
MYQLRVGQMHEVAFIANGGKIGAFRNFFGVLLLLDRVFGDADVMIVLQRQLHGLVQVDVAGGSGTAWLSSKGAGLGEHHSDQQQL